MTGEERAGWLADKLHNGGDYGKEAAALLVKQAHEIEVLRSCLFQMQEAAQSLCADAARYQWLRGWLTREGLLRVMDCTPDVGADTGLWWVLRRPYVIDADCPPGYGKSEEEAVDKAMERSP